MKNNAKTVVILLSVLLTAAAQASTPAGAGASAATAPNEAPAAGLPSHSFANDSNFTFGTGGRLETGGMFWRMMLAVLLVLALGAAAYYVSKKLGPRIANVPGRQIHLTETFYLGSKKTLHLIKVGDKNILIAATPTSITAIAELGPDTKSSANSQE
jgi:flagellar biogenesis protein FliO